MTDAELRQQCHTVIPGHKQLSPAQSFAAMAAWCDANQVSHDHYGSGALIQQFEQKIADLLGMEAAVFCISGTMAQVTALRLAGMERGSRLVALHPTAHILRHERSNFQLLDHFQALQVGDPMRPFTVADLQAIPDRLGAVALELPMREIGGQCPSWEELRAIKHYCRDNNIHLHVDGARLWEAAAGYDRSPRSIVDDADSVYISLYKGLGGMGGAMLAGSQGLVDKAREWCRRQGGNVYQRSPYVVAAAMQFERRIAAMPAYFRRTEWLYAQLAAYPALRPNPARPQANMLHLHVPVSVERAMQIRNHIAAEHGIWLFGWASHAALAGHAVIEWYVGDNLLDLDDRHVHQALALFAAALRDQHA